MWTTVLVLALALNFEPNRLGVVGFLLLRPHPIRQLLIFLCSSFAMSLTVGLVVLFLVDRGALLRGGSSSAVLQIAVGALALLGAGLLAGNDVVSRRRRQRGPADPQSDAESPTAGGVTIVDTVTRRAGRLVQGDSLWFAAALGIGISLPSVDFVALLLLIAASGQPPDVQLTALLTFLVVANCVLLIPIISYVVARQRTLDALERLRVWVLARSRRDYAVLLAVAGTLLIAVGLQRL